MYISQHCNLSVQMGRSFEYRKSRLVEDGRGYKTPLQEAGDDALELLRRDVAALPRRPRHPARRPRKLHEQRPPPKYERKRSLTLTSLHLLLAAVIIGCVVFSVLAGIGKLISPDLTPLPNGIAPYGPRVLITFGLYIGTGLAAGCGTAYWLLRQGQH